VSTSIVRMTDDVKGRTEAASAARRSRGDATRVRILQAADVEFANAGYQGTTMARIAERAGVSVQAVYFYFRTKPLLLRELIVRAVMGYADPVRPEDADWFNELLQRTDGVVALRAFSEGGTPIFHRASVANETARAAAPTDVDVAKVYADVERLREEQFQRIASALEQHGALRPDLTVRTATDILLTLASPQTYLQLTHRRGWTDEHWTDWLADSLARLLLAERNGPDRARVDGAI